MAQQAEFDDFVVARSQELLRSAYLLVRDEEQAEELLQAALARTWFAWHRVGDPEAYVRRAMVRMSTSRWHRRWQTDAPGRDESEVAADDLAALEDRTPERLADVHVLVDIQRWRLHTAVVVGVICLVAAVAVVVTLL